MSKFSKGQVNQTLLAVILIVVIIAAIAFLVMHLTKSEEAPVQNGPVNPQSTVPAIGGQPIAPPTTPAPPTPQPVAPR